MNNTIAPHRKSHVQTVTGPVLIGQLGRTLVHEHLQIALPGWNLDTIERGSAFRERVKRCAERIEELKGAGYSSLIDPCPTDLGRDAELMREVASATRFNIICAAGFFFGDVGQKSHWMMRMALDPDATRRVADVLVKDIVEGIGETGVKAGILKVATGKVVTPYEEMLLKATAIAALETGVPVTTHTEAIHGDIQVDTMGEQGLDASRVIVGHSCGSSDKDYLTSVLQRGAYLGFDRFGYEDVNSDENRVAMLAQLAAIGFGDRLVVSHDCVLCYRGLEQFRLLREDGMLHIHRVIIPKLREAGMDQGAIDKLLIDNPARFFAGPTLPTGVPDI